MSKIKNFVFDYEAGLYDEETAELIEMADFYQIGDFAPLPNHPPKPEWLQRYLDKPSDRTPEDYGGYDD